MILAGYIGRCRAKGCKHVTRTDKDTWFASCPEHGTYKVKPIWADERPDIKCGAKCRNAVGPSCDCSCAGANHGINH